MSRTPVYKRFMSGASMPSIDIFKKILTNRVLLIGASEVIIKLNSNAHIKNKKNVYIYFLYIIIY